MYISLAGPPLTNETALTTLLGNEVKVALGIRSGWEAHTMRLNLQWVGFWPCSMQMRN